MSTENHLCATCGNIVRPHLEAVECDRPTCRRWTHTICGTGISRKAYRQANKQRRSIEYICQLCRSTSDEISAISGSIQALTDVRDQLESTQASMENSGHDVPNFSLGFQAAENSTFDISREERPMETEDIEVARIQAALTKSLPARCTELETIIKNTSNKELRTILPYIIENIFGFGSEPGWGLDSVSKIYAPYDYDCVVKFLSPEGPLLKLIYALQSDVYLQYEFPINCLPSATRMLIEEGTVPPFFIQKLHQQNFGRPTLVLSAFEFFCFHLAFFMVSPNNQKYAVQWRTIFDFVYPTVLSDYLEYFFPSEKKRLPPMPNTPSPVRSHVNHMPSSSPLNTTPPRHMRSSLLRSHLLTAQKSHTQSSPVLEQVQDETWRSETLLQVLVEFWLNQNPVSTDRFYTSSVGQSFNSSMHHPFMEHFMPSPNLVKLIRILVKTVHFFVNSAGVEIVTSAYQTQTTSSLDHFKRTVVQQIFQKKMYAFFKHAFDRWPLDTDFKLVLETWLSYIQPWRYTDDIQRKGNFDVKEIESKLAVVDERWYPFIEDNLLFYVVFFREFLPRIMRMDFTSLHCSYMVFRVGKVFGLRNLSPMLKAAEDSKYGSHFHMAMSTTTDLGASYLSSDYAAKIAGMTLPNVAEWEEASFQYIPLFGDRTNRAVQGLLRDLVQANKSLNERKPHKTSWFDFSSWFTEDGRTYGDITAREKRNIQMYLDKATKSLSIIFDLPLPELPHIHDESSRNFTNTSFGLDQSIIDTYSSIPDCKHTENGPELTPMGRYQMMNGIRKFSITYYGDPDTQPIRSYENATVVRILYQLTSHINKQYAAAINDNYYREDWIGRMMKVFLTCPLKHDTQLNSPISREKRESLQNPRVSLRFLANYKTLAYLVLLYIFLSLWMGSGPVGFVFLLIVLVILYGLLHAVFVPFVSNLFHPQRTQ